MSLRSPYEHESKVANVSMDDSFENTSLPPEKAGTVHDRRDMARLGKVQELRRNFSFIPIFGFAAVLMMTWASVLRYVHADAYASYQSIATGLLTLWCSSVSYILPNGGLPAMIYIYIVTLFGFGAANLSMAEMASMAPTSGGQYHWYVS